jgi:hypothetical protein
MGFLLLRVAFQWLLVAVYGYFIAYDLWYSTGQRRHLPTGVLFGLSAYFSTWWGLQKIERTWRICEYLPILALIWEDLPFFIGRIVMSVTRVFYEDDGILDMRTWTLYASCENADL